MREVFFDSHGHLRSGWRFTAFLFSFLVLSFFAQVLVISIVGQQEEKTGFLVVIFSVVSSVISISLGWVYGIIFENIPPKALGISPVKGWIRDFVAGFLIGFLTLAVAVLISSVFGGLRLELNQNLQSQVLWAITAFFGTFFVAALSEEALFRGYMLQTFCRSNLTWFGVVSSSVLFAAAHNSNPSASWISFLNTFIAGIWLCFAYLKTRNLWFPLGIHIAWNWFQGCFFGINVSGFDRFSKNSILVVTEKGNAFVGGGDYGLEGGIACTVSLIISTFVIRFLPTPKIDEELLKFSTERYAVSD